MKWRASRTLPSSCLNAAARSIPERGGGNFMSLGDRDVSPRTALSDACVKRKSCAVVTAPSSSCLSAASYIFLKLLMEAMLLDSLSNVLTSAISSILEIWKSVLSLSRWSNSNRILSAVP
ncbi:hypothetical protein OGATHE_001584 [Ogataea polymorpha]|uniref:Uncharacterized protein n=1 Tax=Ogataea polymorpha TaxID=460523 RepID=A0A9P8TDX5_9ASCO|nr:hypothetical protein OGATHE_001584 [Ogataea polymorpha]